MIGYKRSQERVKCIFCEINKWKDSFTLLAKIQTSDAITNASLHTHSHNRIISVLPFPRKQPQKQNYICSVPCKAVHNMLWKRSNLSFLLIQHSSNREVEKQTTLCGNIFEGGHSGEILKFCAIDFYLQYAFVTENLY